MLGNDHVIKVRHMRKSTLGHIEFTSFMCMCNLGACYLLPQVANAVNSSTVVVGSSDVLTFEPAVGRHLGECPRVMLSSCVLANFLVAIC